MKIGVVASVFGAPGNWGSVCDTRGSMTVATLWKGSGLRFSWILNRGPFEMVFSFRIGCGKITGACLLSNGRNICLRAVIRIVIRPRSRRKRGSGTAFAPTGRPTTVQPCNTTVAQQCKQPAHHATISIAEFARNPRPHASSRAAPCRTCIARVIGYGTIAKAWLHDLPECSSINQR